MMHGQAAQLPLYQQTIGKVGENPVVGPVIER